MALIDVRFFERIHNFIQLNKGKVMDNHLFFNQKKPLQIVTASLN